MTAPSLHDLQAQLESIDACLRKYVRLRAQLIEVIAFMEDEKEQEFLRSVKEKSRSGAPATDPAPAEPPAPHAPRPFQNAFRPAPSAAPSGEPSPMRTNPFATTLSMEA